MSDAATHFARDHFGGVYQADSAVVPASCTTRGTGDERLCIIGAANGRAPAPTATESGSAIYGGFIFRHFGHVVTETLSRLWLAHEATGKAPIYMQSNGGKLPRLASELFKLAGLADAIHIVREDTTFGEVLVPSPALVLRDRAHKAFKDLCLRIADRALGRVNICASEQPLYLSRSQLGPGQRPIVGEVELEDHLTRAGVRVVHTQKQSLIEQIRLVNSHRTIIAPVGSAVHLLLFSRIVHDVFCYLKSPPNPTYLLCDALNGSRTRYLRTTSQQPVLAHSLLKHWEYPELLDVSATVRALEEAGVIGSIAARAQRSHESPDRMYTRLFLEKAIEDARRWKSGPLACLALQAAQTSLPDTTELVRAAELSVSELASEADLRQLTNQRDDE